MKTTRPEKLFRILPGQDNKGGASWYFVDLYLDMDLQHNCKNVYILFEGVTSECKVYVNGEFFGQNSICGKPFIIEVPLKSLVWQNKEKANDIAIVVKDGSVNGFIAAIMTE